MKNNGKGRKMPKKAPRPQRKAGPRRNGNRVSRSLGNGMSSSAPMNYGGNVRTGNSRGKRDDGRVLVPNQGFKRTAVMPINGSVGYAVNKIEINPGLAASFPWHWREAALYESYLFTQLRYLFVSSKSAATDGLVCMGVDYDAADATPASMEQVQNYWGSVTNKVWENFEVRCDRADLDKFGVQRYVRTAPVADTDIKTYDVGNMYIATTGCADTSQIGQLFVEYQVWLMTPQLYAPGEDVVAERILCTGTTKATPFATAVITGGLGVTVATNVMTFPQLGYYLVTYAGSGTVLINPVVTAGTGTGALLNGIVDAASTSFSGHFTANITAPNQTIVFDVTGSNTVTSVVLRICKYQMYLADEPMLVRDNFSSDVKSHADGVILPRSEPVDIPRDVVDFGRIRSLTQGVAQMKMAGYPDHRSPLGPSRE